MNIVRGEIKNPKRQPKHVLELHIYGPQRPSASGANSVIHSLIARCEFAQIQESRFLRPRTLNHHSTQCRNKIPLNILLSPTVNSDKSNLDCFVCFLQKFQPFFIISFCLLFTKVQASSMHQKLWLKQNLYLWVPTGANKYTSFATHYRDLRRPQKCQPYVRVHVGPD